MCAVYTQDGFNEWDWSVTDLIDSVEYDNLEATRLCIG